MFEKIMDLVKKQVMDKVSGNSEIPADKKEQTIDTATSSLMDSLKRYATPDNISSIASMFGAGKKEEITEQKAAGITNGIKSDMITNLISKVGLSQGTANNLASGIVPAIMFLFSKKVSDDNDPDFNIGSILSSFTGDKNSDKSGVMDMVGSILGKK
ncbi:MAG: hypothetical protein LUF90_08735 [Rikenellaceae bacterium]|nr:hypothetical protein [Rikenellaceae bacterium]